MAASTDSVIWKIYGKVMRIYRCLPSLALNHLFHKFKGFKYVMKKVLPLLQNLTCYDSMWNKEATCCSKEVLSAHRTL